MNGPQQRFRALVYWEGWEDDPFVIDLVTAADAEEARQLVSTLMMRTYWRWRGEPVRIVVKRAWHSTDAVTPLGRWWWRDAQPVPHR